MRPILLCFTAKYSSALMNESITFSGSRFFYVPNLTKKAEGNGDEFLAKH